MIKSCGRQTIRFALGALFGASLTACLVFFPFPNGKTYSLILAPVTMALAYLIEKYTTCTTLLPLSLIRIFQRKASLIQLMCVYGGMYFGSSYVMKEIRYAIASAPAKDQEHMAVFMEQLFLSLKEPIQSRLQQAAIVMAFYHGLEHVIVRLTLHLFALVWLMTLPELNPVLALAWFQGSTKFDGTGLARFWVNMVFLIAMCGIGAKLVLSGFSQSVRVFKYCNQWRKQTLRVKKPKQL